MSAELRIRTVAKLPGLSVEVGEVLEAPSGKEVVLDVVHGTLDPGRTVGITEFVGLETKPESLGEGLHLWDRDHVSSRSPQDDDMGVIDQTA
jgi:hypothetical protein